MMWCVYIAEYYSAVKENEIMPFTATWMDLEIIILSEVSQTDKDKYHAISFTCGIQKMIQMNSFTKQTHGGKNQLYYYQRGSGKWWGKEKLQVWDYIYTAIYKTGSTV